MITYILSYCPSHRWTSVLNDALLFLLMISNKKPQLPNESGPGELDQHWERPVAYLGPRFCVVCISFTMIK